METGSITEKKRPGRQRAAMFSFFLGKQPKEIYHYPNMFLVVDVRRRFGEMCSQYQRYIVRNNLLF